MNACESSYGKMPPVYNIPQHVCRSHRRLKPPTRNDARFSGFTYQPPSPVDEALLIARWFTVWRFCIRRRILSDVAGMSHRVAPGRATGGSANRFDTYPEL